MIEQTEKQDQKHITRHIISQARYMAWDDARAHFEVRKVWDEQALEKNALKYSLVDPWYYPFITPDKEQRTMFSIAYMNCYRQEIVRRNRKAKGYHVRAMDFHRQLISCGGYIWTRKEFYGELIKEGNTEECAEYFAFGTQEYETGAW